MLAGVLPALLWLWFWLKEAEHPEPRKLIIYSFLGGMIAVPLVVPFELWVKNVFPGSTQEAVITVLILWAAIEECFKFGAAYWTGISRKEDRSPIDPVIYMITAALGFAAIENFLFILTPLDHGQIVSGIYTGGLRFIGATLLHVISSASVGISYGLAFYKNKWKKVLHVIIGLVIAIALHSTFNYFIMSADGSQTFIVFYGVWLAVIGLALFLEKLKFVHMCKISE